jgi:acyl carrier protein
MNRELEKSFLRAAAEALNVPVEELSLASAKGSIPAWDSVGHLMLLLAIEGAFGVKLSTQEIEKLTTLAELFDKVQQREAEGRSAGT